MYCYLQGPHFHVHCATPQVARSFSVYLALLCNLQGNFFEIAIADGAILLDPMAAALIILLTLLLCMGTKEMSWFNTGGGWAGVGPEVLK